MTYAVDSNIIIDILIDDQEYAPRAVEALIRASRDGNLIACDVVWAEASSHFTDKVQFRKVMSDDINETTPPSWRDFELTYTR